MRIWRVSSDSGPDVQHRRRLTGRAAEQRAQPRDQLLHLERLGQVVVGAGVDPLDPLGPHAARGEDEDRQRGPAGPPPLQHRQPVELGQAEIEDRGVIGLRVALEPGLLAVRHHVDGHAGSLERGRDVGCDARLVLDDEDLH